MNHAIENSLILAILFSVITIPVYWAIKSARNKKKKRINDILTKAEGEAQLHLQPIEQLEYFALAIDQKKKVLLHFDYLDEDPHLIDLHMISDCVLQEKKLGNNTQLLDLLFLDKNQLVKHRIVFYQQYQHNEWRLKQTLKTAAEWEVLLKRVISILPPSM